MCDFKTFTKAIRPTILRIYQFSDEEHASQEKFISKLMNSFLEGASTGIFDQSILDLEKNLFANINHFIHKNDLSEELRNTIEYLSTQIQYFKRMLAEPTVFEEKCIYGMEAAFLYYRNDRLTHRRLAGLFIDLNEDVLDIDDANANVAIESDPAPKIVTSEEEEAETVAVREKIVEE